MPGFIPQLVPWLCAGSFDEGVSSRFETPCGPGSRLGDALGVAWAALRDKISMALGATVDAGSLGVEAAYVGTLGGVPIDKFQRALPLQREEARVPLLRRGLAEWDAGSVEFAVFRCCDRFSSQLLLALPARVLRITNRGWAEAAVAYFGLSIPACAAHVGKPIAGTSAVVGEHGLVFFNDRSLFNREEGRTR